MSHQIMVAVTINADRAKVWDCYTSPNHIVKWNFADPSWYCPTATNNMKIGGTYKARMEAKDGSFGFDFEAVYTVIDMGKSFEYEFGGRNAKVLFTENGSQTTVVVTFDPESHNPEDMQKSGWQSILNNFKQYTESVR